MTEQTGRQPFQFRFPFWLNPTSATTQRPPQNTTTSQPPRPQSRPAAPFTNLLSTTTRQNGQAISSPTSTSASLAQTSQSPSSARGTPNLQPTTQTRRQPPQPSIRSSKAQSPHQSPRQTSRQSLPPTASPTSPSQAPAIVIRSVASQRPSPSPISAGPSQSKSVSLAQSNPEPTTKFHSETLHSPSIDKLDSESQPATAVPLDLWPASISTKPTASPEKSSISQASSHSQPQKIPNSPDKISGKSPSKLSEETNKKIHEVSLGSTLEADKKKDERKNITKLQVDQLGERKTPEDEEPKRKAEIPLPISSDHQIQFGSVPMPSTERKITRPNKVEKHREQSEDKSVMKEYKGDKSKHLTPTKQHSSHTTVTDMHPRSSISNSETVNLEKENRQDTSRYVHQATATYHQTEDDSSVNVITLTGENKGAHMNISSKARNREGLVHIHRGYKVQMEDKVDITKNVDETAKGQPDSPRSQMLEANATYANSNSQGINNSILYNSSCSERNPGIHLTLSYGRLTTANQSKERKDLLKTLKENSLMKPTAQVASQTNIRRRCLRALFMESSESDPENQHKPRRHGCRYKCGEI